MSDFKVRLSGLDAVLDEHRRMSSLMTKYSSDVNQVKNSLSMKVRQRAGIDTKLRKISQDIQEEHGVLSRMANAGQTIYWIYQAAERQAANMDQVPDFNLRRAGVLVTNFATPEKDGDAQAPEGKTQAPNPGKASAEWTGYEFDDKHPGVTAWVGKAGAEYENEDLYAGVNGYLGKAEAEAKASVSFANRENKNQYKEGKWDSKTSFDYFSAEAGVAATVAGVAGDAKIRGGDDIFGAEASAEGSLLSAEASAKGKLSYGDNGVDAYVEGKALVAAAEGKASASFNLFGFEIKTTVEGYAGAAGVKGKFGVDESKFTAEVGAAAVLGFSVGIEIGFNPTGWNNVKQGVKNFLDFINPWD